MMVVYHWPVDDCSKENKGNQKSGRILLFEIVFGMYLQNFRAKYDDFMEKIPKYIGTYSNKY